MSGEGMRRRLSRPPLVRATKPLEAATGLDPTIDKVRPAAAALIASPCRQRLLHGDWMGHAIHPLMTDLPLGLWASATVLDLTTARKVASRHPAHT